MIDVSQCLITAVSLHQQAHVILLDTAAFEVACAGTGTDPSLTSVGFPGVLTAIVGENEPVTAQTGCLFLSADSSADTFREALSSAVYFKSQGVNGRCLNKPRSQLITPREQEILDLVTEGLGNKEIAARLGVQTHTIKNHISHLLEKLHMQDRVQLAVYNHNHRHN